MTNQTCPFSSTAKIKRFEKTISKFYVLFLILNGCMNCNSYQVIDYGQKLDSSMQEGTLVERVSAPAI